MMFLHRQFTLCDKLDVVQREKECIAPLATAREKSPLKLRYHRLCRWKLPTKASLCVFFLLLHLSHGFVLPCMKHRTACRSMGSSMSPLRQKVVTAATRGWEIKFNELVKFKEKHGHANVPQIPNKEIPQDYKELSTFCRNMRTQYRYLSDPEKAHLSYLDEDRVKKLESIGFIWNVQDAIWMSRFEELKNFRERYGHCNVPSRWKENPGLTHWMVIQRQRYKIGRNRSQSKRSSLPQKRIELLESIGFEWDTQYTKWWANYETLKAYKAKHGHLNITRGNAPSNSLLKYVYYLKRCCREYVIAYSITRSCEDTRVSGLDEERLEALREVGFCWLPDPDAPYQEPPEDIFEKAWETSNAHGTTS